MRGKIKILIAEHDSTDLELISYQLQKDKIDYESRAVSNETDYVDALKNFTPDIILADYTFPSFDGPTAFKIKQEISGTTPFIFVSGTIGEERSIELIKSGVTDYVLKESLFTLGFKVKRALQESKEATEKKKLEKAFASERERFYEIILQSPSSIGILKGADHIFEMVNPLYLKLIGKRDIIGKTVKEVLPEVVDQGFIAILDEVYNSGKPFFATERLVRLDQKSDGVVSDIYVNIVYQPYRDNQGGIEGILFFTVDVTEQVLSRKKIEESENRFRAIIEKSAEMITLSSCDGKILYISPSATEVFGYALQDIDHRHASGFIHPDDIREFAEKRKKILDTDGGSCNSQLRLLHKNGSWIWCDAVLTNMLHEPGVNAMVSNFRDISEKKIAEQQQEFNNNNLNALINNTNDLLWSVDRDFNLITFNRPFQDIIKLMSGKGLLKGDSVLEVAFPEEQLKRYKNFYERAFAGEAFTEMEFSRSPAGGLWSEISFYPICKGETITGTACHSRDITKNKKAEQNLIQSEKRYRQILETAQEGIWLIDENNVTTFVNDKMCEILEYSKEEMIGVTYLSFKKEEEQKGALEQIARRKKGIRETHESKFLTKSGRVIWARISGSPIQNENGTYAGALAMMTDITERKKTRDETKSLTNRLLLATKSAGMGIWEWDIKHDHLDWDKAMFELYDVNHIQFGSIYEGWLSRLHIEDRARVNEDIQQAITGGRPYDTEFRINWSDRSVHYIKAKGITEMDAEGNIVKLVGVNWDITAQKEKEQQLKLLESVITNTTDSVLITEAEPFDEPGHKIVYVNDAFTRMTGYTFEEMIGKTPRILQGPKSDKAELARFSEAIRKWQPFEITIINYKKNGEEFWINFSVSPVANENGWFTHWISIEKDVTERKLAEIHLSQLNKDLRKHAKDLAVSNAELEQFAYVASHDLQEPLRMITSFLTQLEKKYGHVIDEKGKKYIDFAVDGSKRMRQIILDLLEFSRIGRTEETSEIIDLNKLVQEIQILFRKQITDRKAVFTVDELPNINVHVSPMRQVFQNLIGNALKYSKKEIPAQIDVKVADMKDHWRFAISDNGIGIEKEYFDKIFIIFQRLHSKDEFPGTGMGLAITKKIIETWGGKIWLESEPGKGSSFYFTLLKQF